MNAQPRETFADVVARIAVGFLYLLLSFNLLGDFIRTQHLTGMLLLISEGLVAIMTLFRRPALAVDRSTEARVITGLALAGPPLLRTMDNGGLLPDQVTAVIGTVGLCIVIAGKWALGRSFGIAPANRGVVVTGPYMFVRHPIYTGYVLTHIAFVIAHPRTLNILIVLISDAALIVRSLLEERILLSDERYRSYCSRVGWHLLPGVF